MKINKDKFLKSLLLFTLLTGIVTLSAGCAGTYVYGPGPYPYYPGGYYYHHHHHDYYGPVVYNSVVVQYGYVPTFHMYAPHCIWVPGHFSPNGLWHDGYELC